MATGQTIINRALRLIGAIASGESPTGQESTDALEALNAMLETWRLEKLVVFAHQTESLTLIPNQGTYTIGPTGGLNTIRPIKIEEAYVRQGDLDSPVNIFTEQQWSALPSKSLADAIPECLYYEGTYPLGNLQLFPIPTVANSLKLVTWVPLAVLTLATAIALPPGYERAIAYNLAIDLAPEYEKEVPTSVIKVAGDSLSILKRANQRPIEAVKELAGMFDGQRYAT